MRYTYEYKSIDKLKSPLLYEAENNFITKYMTYFAIKIKDDTDSCNI